MDEDISVDGGEDALEQLLGLPVGLELLVELVLDVPHGVLQHLVRQLEEQGQDRVQGFRLVRAQKHQQRFRQLQSVER